MIIYRFFIYISFICATVYSELGVKFIDSLGSSPGWEFQGKLWENSSTVHLSPELRSIPVKGISKSMSICGYTVHHETVQFLPFVVLVIDQRWGYAEIKLKSNLDRNSLSSIYTFQIQAYDCDEIPHFSERKIVYVEIKLNQKPIFTKSSYHFTIKGNTQIGTEIGSVTAFERPENGNEGICRYTIMSESPVPFNVNKYGMITTKVLVLDKIKSIRYRFAVQAVDCVQPVPTTNIVPVMVDVFDDCKPHWTGLLSNVTYDGNKGVVPIVMTKELAPILHVCSENCQNMLAVVSMTLTGIGLRPANANLCRQDDESIIRQERLCDVSKNAMDMLKLAPESLKNRDSRGYYFPGDAAVTVDPTYHHVLSRKFTVMFWMRHADMEVKGLKEQILCNTDSRVHNRHHFSLFLHNCKLILLLRKEHASSKQDPFEPSEWRYGPLKEVCDDKWHHYAVMFNDGALFVQIDGERITESPQHLDDKPLKESPSGKTDTTFTVAACYHAKSDKFVQYFKGHLASVKIVDGEMEAVNNIRCIATCGEALLLPHIVNVMGIQSSVTLFSDSVVIRSHDIYNLLKMFSELSYINTEISEELQGSQTANRTVTIEASIHCDDNQISKATTTSIVINLRKGKITKETKSSARIRVSTGLTMEGFQNERTDLFPKLKFIRDSGDVNSIKSCIVRPLGPILQPWEYIDWPIDMAINLQLTVLNNTHGLVLEGRQVFLVYEMVLTKIYYVTSKVSQRKFAISCSIIDRLVTKDVTVTVNVKQNDLKTYYIVDDPNQTREDPIQVLHQHGIGERKGFEEKIDSIPKVAKKKTRSNAMLWVILPCLLIVVVVVVLGSVLYYKRMKGHHNMGLKKVPSGNGNGNDRLQMKVISNRRPSDSNDDESITNDMPDSGEEDSDENENGEEVDNMNRKDRIVMPTFVRLPPGTQMRSVDV